MLLSVRPSVNGETIADRQFFSFLFFLSFSLSLSFRQKRDRRKLMDEFWQWASKQQSERTDRQTHSTDRQRSNCSTFGSFIPAKRERERERRQVDNGGCYSQMAKYDRPSIQEEEKTPLFHIIVVATSNQWMVNRSFARTNIIIVLNFEA